MSDDDPLNDDVGQLLKKLHSRASWGKEQELTKRAFISLLKSKGYIFSPEVSGVMASQKWRSPASTTYLKRRGVT